ncbi:MAG: hypothetical protein IPH59_11810 [bacterium]|nr:hypothetical protein [bacterium]
MQSTITWISTSVELPDDSLVVLVALESGDEPTWIGYYDSAEDDWFNSDAMRFKSAVSHWAEMPVGPSDPLHHACRKPPPFKRPTLDELEDAMIGASEKMIDVWEVWPHYDQSYDYILTDDGHSIESHVQAVVEAWMDMCPGAGEELTIRVKAKEMSRHDYEEQTSPEP